MWCFSILHSGDCLHTSYFDIGRRGRRRTGGGSAVGRPGTCALVIGYGALMRASRKGQKAGGSEVPPLQGIAIPRIIELADELGDRWRCLARVLAGGNPAAPESRAVRPAACLGICGGSTLGYTQARGNAPGNARGPLSACGRKLSCRESGYGKCRRKWMAGARRASAAASKGNLASRLFRPYVR